MKAFIKAEVAGPSSIDNNNRWDDLFLTTEKNSDESKAAGQPTGFFISFEYEPSSL
jgi:hypothetical protein